ncbi:NAD(P)/FAD-dependent oxidoreductase [Halospina denitrificans]|nr:FAD-dependent oxidoreductase [Halospina denitrificans]
MAEPQRETAMERDLVIIGHGMASQRLLESLVAGRHPWRITVIGAEPERAYNRILLSPLLAGEVTPEQLSFAGPDWYQRHGIRLHTGDGARTIDREQCCVVTEQGARFDYDRLVIATGSRPSSLGLEGENLQGVMGFRSLADVHWLTEQAAEGRRAVVIGGGFLGLEAAEGLRKQGMAVTLVHRGAYPLTRQLDATAGGLLVETLRERGLKLALNSQPARLVGSSRVEALELADGTELPAELVVIAAGITPNREIAADAGLDCGQGIRVDECLTTSDPRVHALGECCEFAGQTYGLVEPVNRQADVLAQHLSGLTAGYRDEPVATRLKISGIDVFSCGETDNPGDGTESIVYHDRRAGEYRHLLLRDNRLVGAILYGDASAGPWLFEHLQQGTDLSDWRPRLAFGEAHCEAA